MKIQRSLCFVLALTASAFGARGELRASPVRADSAKPLPPKPMDFASGIPLTLQPGLAVQTLLLPLEVYRGSQNDLSDLSVFDAEGHPVAWALRALAPESEVQREERAVPFFALRGPETARATELALRIERSPDGTIIDVRTPQADAGVGAETGKLLAFIVHTGESREELTALRFELAEGGVSALLAIQVEASDNLSDWQLLGGGETIGRLVHDGQRVERTRVSIAPTRAPFLRLTWSGDLPFTIAKVHVEHERVRPQAGQAEATLTLGPIPFKDDVYELDLGASLALLDLSPRLSADDVLLKASLFAGDEVALARKVFEGQLYHLTHQATALSSQPIFLSGVRARLLSLRVDARASEPPKQPLLFDVRYAPEQLLFVAHGTKPHLLAFGSHRAEPSPFSADQLIAFLSPAQRADLPVQSAERGATRTLAGPLARKAPAPPASYRTALLWSVLVAGAGTLVLLALRLLQKTRAA